LETLPPAGTVCGGKGFLSRKQKKQRKGRPFRGGRKEEERLNERGVAYVPEGRLGVVVY